MRLLMALKEIEHALSVGFPFTTNIHNSIIQVRDKLSSKSAFSPAANKYLRHFTWFDVLFFSKMAMI
jgi:hypothetical protein